MTECNCLMCLAEGENSPHRRRMQFTECEYPNCKCPRRGRCGNAIKDEMEKPAYPVSEADKKLATDWYTWGFQSGMEAERQTAARRAGSAVPVSSPQGSGK